MATHAHTTEAIRPATVAMLAPFFPRWRGDASEPAISAPLPHRPSPTATARQTLEAAVENAITALDAFDGDPDLEQQCEDEGAQCDDEGAIDYQNAPEYGLDQRAPLRIWA